MSKGQRYNVVKNLILNKQLKSIAEAADLLDETNFKNDLKTHLDTLKKKLQNPGLFTFEDAAKIAHLIGVDEKMIADLILEEYLQNIKASSRKK